MIVGVSNGAAEEDWCWDLNPGATAIPRREPCGFGRVGTLWVWQELGPRALGCSLLPHGSGLTGDHSGDTKGGFATKGLPEPRTSTSFPEIQYPRLGRGKRKGCVRLWVF